MMFNGVHVSTKSPEKLRNLPWFLRFLVFRMAFPLLQAMSESGKSIGVSRLSSGLWQSRSGLPVLLSPQALTSHCLLGFLSSSLNERPTHPSHLFLYSISKRTCHIRKRGSNPCDLDCYMRPSQLRVFTVVHHLLHHHNVLRALNLRQEFSHTRQLSWVLYRHQTCLNTRSPKSTLRYPPWRTVLYLQLRYLQ
jgi:hypothetical protein